MAALGEPLLMTVEQFQSLPERSDVLEELHWGCLVTLSRPKPWHIKLQVRTADLLRPLSAEAGYVITELPFRAVTQYDLRAADVAFISRERWDGAGDKDLIGAPELVVEILSPSNTKSQLQQYMALCLANGCEEFWAVDRSTETVTVTEKEGRSIVYTKEQSIPIQLFNGRMISVSEIFK
ncbi:MAG: Uma2 family endonuclease [Acidobacteriaceae bacterium]|nr:Uma2 family endonuclease [Acidobacteriaceae bacterium]